MFLFIKEVSSSSVGKFPWYFFAVSIQTVDANWMDRRAEKEREHALIKFNIVYDLEKSKSSFFFLSSPLLLCFVD
ncbi:hypothetical protein PS15m_004305 [Mucor circinelloides]